LASRSWELKKGGSRVNLELRGELMALDGYLHAAKIVALADTYCGYVTFVSLPEGAEGFTTVELRSKPLGTRRAGVIGCEVRMVHGGRTTQI
jgi:1,4-dihydroxy-2-naphthoyl-CoA hydrolase